MDYTAVFENLEQHIFACLVIIVIMSICKVILLMTASWLLRDAAVTCIVVEFTVNYLVMCTV